MSERTAHRAHSLAGWCVCARACVCVRMMTTYDAYIYISRLCQIVLRALPPIELPPPAPDVEHAADKEDTLPPVGKKSGLWAALGIATGTLAKPRSVARYAVTLIDFGLAKPVPPRTCDGGTRGDARALTASTGTPRYMAPEIARGEQYGASADVYSAALVTWAAVTRQRPFEGLGQDDLFSQVACGTKRPHHTKAAPPAFASLLTAAWAPHPNDRPTSTQLARDLGNLLARARFGGLLDWDKALQTTPRLRRRSFPPPDKRKDIQLPTAWTWSGGASMSKPAPPRRRRHSSAGVAFPSL